MERPMVLIDLQQEPRLARDLTAGGVYVMGCSLEINSECSLVVRGASEELCLTARVVFVDGNRGAGLELVGFGAAMRAQLSALIGAAPTASGSGQTQVPTPPPDEEPAIARTMSPREPAVARTSSPRGTDPPQSRTRTPVRAADDDGHVARTRTPPGGTDRRALLDQLDFARTRSDGEPARASSSPGIASTQTGPNLARTQTEPAFAPRTQTEPGIARTQTGRGTSPPAIARTRTPIDEPDTPTDPVTLPDDESPIRFAQPEPAPPIAIPRTRARSSEQPVASVEPPPPSGWLDDALATFDPPVEAPPPAVTEAGPVWTGDDLVLADAPLTPRPDSTERIPLAELLADEPAEAPFELELELLPPAEPAPPRRVITDEVQTMDDDAPPAAADPAEQPLVAAEIDPAELGGEGDEKKRLALNHYERLRGLTLAQAIKKATSVDSGERIILERLYGKSVWEALLRNPRLTPPEVARIARMGALPRPLLELITSNGAWLQIGEIRRALLTNPRLGTDQILRVLRMVPKHELKLVGSQTVYPHPVRDAAKRLIKEMGEKG